jgi:hypothetical protein
MGLLVAKQVHTPRSNTCHLAWRDTPQTPAGQALRWWLKQLDRPATREALLQPVHRV